MLLNFLVNLTFDHNSMSISPAVVSIITRPFVGRAIEEFEVEVSMCLYLSSHCGPLSLLQYN